MGEQLQPLDIERITAEVAGLSIGQPLHYLPVVDSTNQVARQLGLPHGAAVMADYQAAGRGRRGRAWQAPPRSSLLMSVALRPPPGQPIADILTVAALAVSDAVRDQTGLDVTLKWPNDVLVSGRKLCGMLAEHDSATGHVVIGIGLNVNFIPDITDARLANATSTQRELGRLVDREALAGALFARLNLWYRMLTEDADVVHHAWVDRLGMTGKVLEVHDDSGTWDGMAVEVQRDGALRVRDSRGEVRVLYAADVSVRDPNKNENGVNPGRETEVSRSAPVSG